MINYEEILNKPAFRALEEERKEAFRQLMRRIEGKNTMEVMGAVLDFSKNMPKGRELTREEQSAMTQTLLDGMDTGDKQKFSAVMKMLEMMNRPKK